MNIMKNLHQILSFLLILPSAIVFSQESKLKAGAFLENNKEEYVKIALEIWNNPELGYLEFESSAKLQGLLAKEGFSIEKGIAGLPTAFIASYGKGSPVIGIMGEFDALPGLSQEAIPEKKSVVDGGPGHGCGHHVFGVASAAAAISVRHWLEETGTSGTIKFFGTPAEEGGSGKVYMVRAGLFNDLDIALHWHPADLNSANPWSTNANISAKFRFSGIASHAAGAPEKGRSALDGVEAMNYMVNMMREHLPEKTRIHYVITGGGGTAPNVVPAKAEVYYYVRYPNAIELMDVLRRVVKAAEGAALGTGTEMEYEIMGGVHSVLPNVALSKILDSNLREVGGVYYNEEEKVYAEKIRAGLMDPKTPMIAAETVTPFVMFNIPASSDVGDVSWNVPTAGLATAVWVPGTPAHSWQAVSCGGTSIAMKAMMNAAKALSYSAIDLFMNTGYIVEAKKEFMERRGPDYVYRPLLGDREPPLDYRK